MQGKTIMKHSTPSPNKCAFIPLSNDGMTVPKMVENPIFLHTMTHCDGRQGRDGYMEVCIIAICEYNLYYFGTVFQLIA